MVSFNGPKQIFDVRGLLISIGTCVIIEEANSGAYGANGTTGIFLGLDADSDSGRDDDNGYKIKIGSRIWDVGLTPKLKLITTGDLPWVLGQ